MSVGCATPRFFRSEAAFRDWLAAHSAGARELWVGFHKKDSGKGGLTYPQALDEALCFGWIDGIRRAVDAESFTIRFTPRRPRSIWSPVNLRHFERLKSQGRVTPTGLKTHAERNLARSGSYSFENLPCRLPAAAERRFKEDAAAWGFFRSQPPSYRRVAIFWVTSAKREETRARRLARLMRDSANQHRVSAVTGRK